MVSELGKIKPIDNVEKYIEINKDSLYLNEKLRTSIEVILVLDVIEHIEYSISFLTDIIKQYLNSKYNFISVPSRIKLWSSYDIIYSHYRRNIFNMIKETASYLSLKFIVLQYILRLLYISALIGAKTTVNRNLIIKATQGKLKTFIHSTIVLILYSDYKLHPVNLRGSSIISLMQKTNNNYEE